jgi:hypothetical protein
LESIEAETKEFMLKRNAAGQAAGERENELLAGWRLRKAAEAENDNDADHVDDGESEALVPFDDSFGRLIINDLLLFQVLFFSMSCHP